MVGDWAMLVTDAIWRYRPTQSGAECGSHAEIERQGGLLARYVILISVVCCSRDPQNVHFERCCAHDPVHFMRANLVSWKTRATLKNESCAELCCARDKLEIDFCNDAQVSIASSTPARQ